jgi:peptidoglycan/xylan/chitin deacetylase (PgdA/CDA1 family)
MITLLYHDLVEPGHDDSSGFPGPGAAHYKLSPAEFADHLAALGKALGRPPVTDLTPPATGPQPWLLSFDDGGISALSPTASLLEAHGWRGLFFITTDQIGSPTFLAAEGVRELRKRGHVIGSHSCSHPARMSQCSREQLLDEWTHSRRVLTDILSEPVTVASVPGGFYSRAVAETAAAAGYTTLFNSEPTTSAGSVNGCTILGRYTITRGMSVRAATALATSRLARWRQAFVWNVKKVAKAIFGPAYLAVRERLLARKYPEKR